MGEPTACDTWNPTDTSFGRLTLLQHIGQAQLGFRHRLSRFFSPTIRLCFGIHGIMGCISFGTRVQKHWCQVKSAQIVLNSSSFLQRPSLQKLQVLASRLGMIFKDFGSWCDILAGHSGCYGIGLWTSQSISFLWFGIAKAQYGRFFMA